MSTWFLWLILSFFLGNPLLAALIVILVVWSAGGATFGNIAGPLKFVRRWQHRRKLKHILEINPHNRKVRLELADLQLERGQYAAALETLRSNFEAGDNDPPTLVTLGLACYGAGHTETAEQLMGEAAKQDPSFGGAKIDLERGRWRLRNGDAPGAKEALERFVDHRKGTVEGRVLLARAVEQLGDPERAQALRHEAWTEYLSAPGFRKKAERLWAWRANPARPLTYLFMVVVLIAVFAAVLT